MNITALKNLILNKYSLIVVLAIAAIIIVYFVSRDQPSSVSIVETDEPQPTQVVSPTVQTSPISPISPVSITSPVETLEEYPLNLFSDGEALFNAGDYLAAINVFSRLIDFDPTNHVALTYRGNAYTQLGDYQNALADYDAALEIVPEIYPQAYYNRGRVYMFLGNYDQALADLEKSIELDNYDNINFAYRANGNIGLIYHRQGEYEKALAAFDASIAANDSNADVFAYRASTYMAMENYNAAISDYQAALARFAGYSIAYQGLGYAYYKTGRFELALEALTQATTLSPDNSQAHLVLGLIHLALDNLEQAQSEISQGVDLAASLSFPEQETIYGNFLTDLRSFTTEQPDKSEDVESLINLIPEDFRTDSE